MTLSQHPDEGDVTDLRLGSLARTLRLRAREEDGQARHDLHDDARAIDVALEERKGLLAERGLHIRRYRNLREALAETYPTAEEVVGAAIAAIHERDQLRQQLTEAQADRERLDWFAAWTAGDAGICPPGNHGGNRANWLVYRQDDSRGELGDVFIVTMLVASKLGIDLYDATREAFNAKSEQMGFPERFPALHPEQEPANG